MGNTTFHVHLVVRDALESFSDAELASLFSNTSTEQNLTADEARAYLSGRLAQGDEVIPLSDECAGFDYTGGGCPGHADPAPAPRQNPLTKKAQVMAVIDAGGRITEADRPGLHQLWDAAGTAVPAWQTALRAAVVETIRRAARDARPGQ